jgi:hypothetical protein
MRKVADRAFAMFDARHGRAPAENQPTAESTMYMAGITASLIWNNAIRCTGYIRLSPEKAFSLNRVMNEAVTDCLADAPMIDASENVSVIITLLRNRRPASPDPAVLERQMERGVHALEIERNNKTAFMRESLPIEKNSSVTRVLERLCGLGDWKKACYTEPGTQVFMLDTRSFLAHRTGDVISLYRTHPTLSDADISSTLIHERLQLAEQWFKATEGTGGLLRYEYSPARNSYITDNNHLRQLATLWAMTELEQFRTSNALSPLIRRTIGHYLDQAICEGIRCHLSPPDGGNIAHSAFMLLTLKSFPDYPDAATWRKKIAAAILGRQRDDGSYRIYFDDRKDDGLDYYPGETMLALMQYHAQSGDVKALQSVERAFPFYRSYWRGNRTTAFIPWHSQANLLLYRATKNPEIPAFVFEMNDWLIANFQVTGSEYPDLLGGFRRPSPGCSTSAYLEGLNDAYVLAVETGDVMHREKYREAILNATRFLLTTQYTPENSFYLVNPSQAIGGFRTSLTNNVQRIDHTQHAVRAMMKVLENGIVE